jgi:hypothetical protein
MALSTADVAALPDPTDRQLRASIIRIEESQEDGKTFKTFVVQCAKLGT